jgi:hypothetical protein
MNTDTKSPKRVERELKTVRVMIGIYCRGNHGTSGELCDECRNLWEYTEQRVKRCPFRMDKPTCLKCKVHCFKPEMRENIRTVMRYAGPRMMWKHPVLTIFHFIDGKKETPVIPGKASKP